MTTPNDPVAGEKRPREEEDIKEEEQPQPPRPNPALQQPANGQINNNTMAQVQAMQGLTGAVGMVQGMGGGGGDPGFDALYIGDLQWVCWSSASSHVQISEADPRFITVDNRRGFAIDCRDFGCYYHP